MNEESIYLDTYVLQQDMYICLSKSILNNCPIEKGIGKFSIYLDQDRQELILGIAETFEEEEK